MLNDEVVFTSCWNVERPCDRNDERFFNSAIAETISLILLCLVRGRSFGYQPS